MSERTCIKWVIVRKVVEKTKSKEKNRNKIWRINERKLSYFHESKLQVSVMSAKNVKFHCE